MAEKIKEKFGLEANLVEGGRGEFTVLVGDKIAAKKGWLMIPSDEKILAGVGEILERQT